jgi:ferredoxin
MIKELRKVVGELLNELDGVLALRECSEGVAPHLFRSSDDLAELVVAPKYPMASVVDLLQNANPDARLGVVARGCDERALIELAKRQQVNLDNLRIIGIACSAEDAEECRCALPYPQNLMVGEKVEGVEDRLIAEHEALTRQERLEFWKRQFAKCLKCYGCRNACPECFCEECVLEDKMWVQTGVLPLPFPSFHVIRAMHTVGKCVGCGECELTCPADIPLTILYSLLRRDAKELFGYEAGASLDNQPPLLVTLDQVSIRG